jgi:hypothetical protein
VFRYDLRRLDLCAERRGVDLRGLFNVRDRYGDVIEASNRIPILLLAMEKEL